MLGAARSSTGGISACRCSFTGYSGHLYHSLRMPWARSHNGLCPDHRNL